MPACRLIHPLRRPASEKRQGTKSLWVGHWLAATAMGISRPTTAVAPRPEKSIAPGLVAGEPSFSRAVPFIEATFFGAGGS
jgi:hypothetical protein